MRQTFKVIEVAEMLGVSDWLIRKEIERGRIVAIEIGHRRVVPRCEIERILGGKLPDEVGA